MWLLRCEGVEQTRPQVGHFKTIDEVAPSPGEDPPEEEGEEEKVVPGDGLLEMEAVGGGAGV